MLNIRVLTGLVAITTITACGGGNLLEERARTQAPRSQSDAGIVLEGAEPGEIQKLLEHNPEAQVRVLNAQHGMYELFGITQAEAQAETRGRAESNVFFELQSLESRGRFRGVSVAAPQGLKVGSLNACKAGAGGPTAVLEAVSPANLNGSSIEPGVEVKVSAAKSKSADGKPLRYAIVVGAPGLSAQPSTLIEKNEASLKPDALGLYQVYLLVQDSNDLCAMDGLRFLATANRPYNGPKAAPFSVKLDKLSHLGLVSAEESWQISQGAGMVIAVIDTGINYNHPALAPAIELNTKDSAGNNRDDDGNGFADDELGWDFVNSDRFPFDDDGHGSHVAGLAAGRGFGLAQEAKIIPVKALTSIGGDAGSIAAAIRYSVDRGAKIINMSLGAVAPMAHPALVSAVDYAERKGVLIVAAAGNGDPSTGLGFDIDEIPMYPASLGNSNILSVAAFDPKNELSVYSNFGKTNVDITAPGGSAKVDPMFSAAYENPSGALMVGKNGTSMAAPVVSGIAAQVWSLAPERTFAEVKELLMRSGRDVPALKPVTVSGRHIDALRAVTFASPNAVLF